MWKPYTNESIGFLNAFGQKLDNYQQRVPSDFPDFSESKGIMAFSDYGGEHKGAKFDSYAFLFVTPDSIKQWLYGREIWRKKFGMENRYLAYKKLSDGVCQRACLPFLNIADLLDVDAWCFDKYC